MAHYAELDKNNIVKRVVVISDTYDSTEEAGIAFCRQFFGGNCWKKTSFNANIRKNFAGNNYTYDYIRNAFIPPKPYPSWILDEETCRWRAPVAVSDLTKNYMWDEITTSWKER